MLVCNCTLAVADCVNCSVYKNYYGTSNIRHDYISEFINRINKYVGPNGVVYSSDRYEIVEKKDWKINNLKQQSEKKSKLYEERHAQAIELKEDLELLKRELKELETNNE